MIKIIYKADPEGGKLTMRAEGHAGYAPAGQDIVCAAVSVLAQTLANADAGKQGRSCCKEWKAADELCAAWRDFCGAGSAETRPERFDGRKLV